MKKDIHPDYQLQEIRCSCGNVIRTKSTAKNLQVEICSACHPFFTGTQKLVDSRTRRALQQEIRQEGLNVLFPDSGESLSAVFVFICPCTFRLRMPLEA